MSWIAGRRAYVEVKLPDSEVEVAQRSMGQLGYGALRLILEELTDRGRTDIITDEVMAAVAEVVGPD